MKPQEQKSDADFAAEIRAEMTVALTKVCEITDRANLRGFQVAYNTGAQGPGTKNKITGLNLTKSFLCSAAGRQGGNHER